MPDGTHRARVSQSAMAIAIPHGTSQYPSKPSNRPTQNEYAGAAPLVVASCSIRSTTTQPACSPIATAIFPVSTRVRLKISPTMSHERNESNTSAGCASGEKERVNRSKPLPQPTSAGAILTFAKKCRMANKGAVRQSRRPRARFTFDRRVHGAAHHGLLDQCDGHAGAQSRRGICARNSTRSVRSRSRRCAGASSSRKAAPTAAVAMPIAPQCELTLRNLRQGRP